jgi:hypothetical protein
MGKEKNEIPDQVRNDKLGGEKGKKEIMKRVKNLY